MIHPTAVVEPGAVLGEENFIGPFCHVGPNVTLGHRNRLEGHVSVGTPPEHREFLTTHGLGVTIGDGCTVREFVTINDGIDRPTVIDDGCLLLARAYVGHDSVLEPNVLVACGALIGGRCHVLTGANVGLGAAIHQMQVIGAWAMIGMNAAVTRSARVS
ncbi:MAG: UDP-N-acetylglucosamine acyltransferase, partial [Acidimicrobiales bacterium]